MDDAAKRRKAQKAAEKRAWEKWQDRPQPIGTSVEVTKDSGEKVSTVTRSEPWLLGDGTPVILLEGITGGYLLTRVRVVP